MRTTLSRRSVLRGAVGGSLLTVGLPRLEAMLNGNGTAYAAGQPLPKRFGIWAWSNGVHLPVWVPKQTGTSWELSDQLMPLAAHREYFSLISGMETKYGVGKGHCQVHTNLLTGMPVKGAGDGPNGGTASGPSIDQIVARQIGAGTVLRSFELGVDNGYPHEKNTASRYFSHTAPYSANIPLHNTRQVFDRLFAMTPTTPGAPSGTLSATAAVRKRLVDVMREDAKSLSTRLGTADRARLAQHLEGIDSIEKRIQQLGSSACMPPPQPASIENATMQSTGVGDVGGTYANLELLSTKINRIMAELLAVALVCDVTRVFTFQYSPPGTRAVYPGLGITRSGYHGYTHVNNQQPECREMVKFYMRELAVFMDVFRATPDGAGNLLDSCGILATTDVAVGLTHSPSDLPMIVIGKAGGALRGGVHYRSTTREAATKGPLTVARAVGANLPSFGVEAQTVTDGVADLLR
jgi:hypothetical protein